MKINVKSKWAVAVLLAAAIVLVMTLFGWNRAEKHHDSREKVTLGIAMNVTSPLMYIAEAKGFFRDNGLDVTIRDYSAGLLAANDLIRNRVDVATCADTVFVIKSSGQKDLRIFATIARADDVEIIFRKNSGITAPADLKGKRIAVTLNTSSHFYLETFLSFYGISIGSVQVVNISPPEMLQALRSGKVDAACTWEPTVSRIKDDLGRSVTGWPAQKGRSYEWLLVAREEFLEARPSTVSRLLKSLIAAEEYARSDPDGARQITARRIHLSESLMRSIWPRFDLRVTLDQDLISILEDQARWAMRRGIIPKQGTPNYLDDIDFVPLEKIDPKAVGVIH